MNGSFFQRLQVFKSIMLGEAELKEPAYDSMCFIDVLQEKEIVDFPSLKIIKQVIQHLLLLPLFEVA